MFKSAILGCRGRARAHVKAYESITRGKNVAICDMNEEALHEFAAKIVKIDFVGLRFSSLRDHVHA